MQPSRLVGTVPIHRDELPLQYFYLTRIYDLPNGSVQSRFIGMNYHSNIFI
jgi:hypothetical protein